LIVIACSAIIAANTLLLPSQPAGAIAAGTCTSPIDHGSSSR